MFYNGLRILETVEVLWPHVLFQHAALGLWLIRVLEVKGAIIHTDNYCVKSRPVASVVLKDRSNVVTNLKRRLRPPGGSGTWSPCWLALIRHLASWLSG